MKRILILAAALALTGCAGINHSMQYASVQKVAFDGYDIFDKPAENKMLINASWSMARKGGLDGGNYNADDFRIAAGSWLAKNGRDCTVTGIAVVLAPTNYEAKYSCR